MWLPFIAVRGGNLKVAPSDSDWYSINSRFELLP